MPRKVSTRAVVLTALGLGTIVSGTLAVLLVTTSSPDVGRVV